jgi:tol-pal system protein YbgF
MLQLLMAAMVVAVVSLAGDGAFAQSSDVSALSDKLARLQADLKDLQRYVYSGGPLPESTASATAGTGGETTAAQVEVRLAEMDQVVRAMRGQIEELGFRVASLEKRMDRLVADLDMRLTALERGGVAGVQPGATGVVEPSAGAGAATVEPGSGSLGALPEAEPETTAALPAEEPLPPGSVMDQYNYAFGLLSNAEYDKAERALGQFIEAHPDDPLAGNALYWLGETYFVRGDYNRAAVTFLRGYREFPEGTKAPDNLLKLGVALGKLDKKTEACATFAELAKKFPNASATIQKKAEAEAGALGCG